MESAKPEAKPQTKSDDPLRRLIAAVGELEAGAAPHPRSAIAGARQQLGQALAAGERGELSTALDLLRASMARLAQLGAEPNPDAGAFLRALAQSFTQALAIGNKGSAKQAVEVRRSRASDTGNDPKQDW